MIITKEFAEKLDKETLAELATKYCNELAEKLGSDKKIKISPEEIICKKDKAEQVFTDDYTKALVQQGLAFVHNNIAYTPLVSPSLEEQVFIFEVAGHDSKKYSHLQGFGAEMGHFTAKKLYRKFDFGLGEALDYVSQLHETSTDFKTICESEGISGKDGLEELLICKKLADAKEKLDAYESLLFKGEDDAIKKLSKICQSEAKNMLAVLKWDYLTTAHFEGIKLAVLVYDNEDTNIGKAYEKMGELMSNPKVNNVLDALRRLYNPKVDTTFGCIKEFLFPNKELSRYEDVFVDDIIARSARLQKTRAWLKK